MDAIRSRIEELRKEILRHNDLYYVQSEPEISDTDYDDLYRELLKLEAEYKQSADPNSPTNMVGGKLVEKLASTKHPQHISSLDKAYKPGEVTNFFMAAKARSKGYSREGFALGYIQEPKYDGLTLVLHYRDGVLVRAVTRGDGYYGNDVTHNAKNIESIPQTLSFEVQNLVVRGEAVIPKAEFEKINATQRAKGEPEYKTARNLVSGSVQQLDPEVVKTRGIQFIPYEVLAEYDELAEGLCVYIYSKGHHTPYIIKTHTQSMKFLDKLGFQVGKNFQKFETLDQIYKSCCVPEFYEKLKALPYDIDGFVLKLDSMKLRSELGAGNTSPHWQVAFKLPQTRYHGRLTGVEWGIGKTGAITPVALFDPIRIDGTDVSRASLHNVNEIKRLGLKIGVRFLIEKAGGIIPAIIEVVPDSTYYEHTYEEIAIPKTCPICGSETTCSETGLLKCSSEECLGTFNKKLLYFVGKKGLDIDGFGDKLCTAITERIVNQFHQVFELTVNDLKPIVGNKAAEKLVAEIKNKRSISLVKFIAILQIPNVGQTSSKLLADRFKNFTALKHAKPSEIGAIDNFGPIATQSIYNYLRNEENLAEIDLLLAHLSIKEDAPMSDKLMGTFCITGTLSQGRKHFEDLITQNGGTIASSVSKNLDYLLAGEEAGSKLVKAKSLGIRIISEQDLLTMIS